MAPKPIAIDLPSTPSEWRKMARNEAIPAPSNARLNAMTAEERAALHLKENPINLSLRDLGGWPSASSMTKPHFLTTRILWQFVTKDQLHKRIIDKVSKTATACAKITSRAMTWTLIAMFTPTAMTSPPSGTRSHGGPVVPGLDGPADDDDSGEDELSSLSAAERSQFSSLHETVSGQSESSALTPDEWSLAEGEDQAAKLDWSHLKKRLDFFLGRANVRSINDGSLRARYTGDVLAVLEVKPIRLIEKGLATLMQMGLEMMTHVLDCEEKKMTKKRYWRISQHFDEIYLTWAEIDDGYIDYLRHGYGSGDTFPFMHLKFVGPFHIHKSQDMEELGHLALSLTVQESQDYTAHISRPYLGTTGQ
ncbi:hypothetical protein CNMCM5793_004146 [Aspergillus hiratsukae]|uniref:Uncharacterized protein n=1 Tax=Aspergillus hiratsukae TaxID=1194566 RepID=A0A8H6PQH7_9EURO|nr:hypothetical protein CNMCM5793_004146 [Aspergillus hiratsukae]KAF7159105.1 hypothetical protein CNMCM6106_006190 [Aspergillus hiratsukae]